MTPLQNEYTDIIQECYSSQPKAHYISNGNKLKDRLYHFTSHPNFDKFITLSIIVNTVCMSTTFYLQPPILTSVMKYLSFAFTTIYTVESALFIYVDAHYYFTDSWRIFDFLIVVIAIIGILFEYII